MSGPRDPLWAEISIPPRLDMLPTVQRAADDLANRCGFDSAARNRIQLAIEELLSAILRLSFDGGAGEEDGISVRCEISPPFFRVLVVDNGLPFDLSLVPPYDPASPEDADVMAASLSLHLAKHCVERYGIVNAGRDGLRFEMSWFLPGDPVGETDVPPAPPGAAAPEPVDDVRALGEESAIQIARLVHRGYGHSYVYGDVYYPDRIRAHFRSGMLKSWGATTPSGRLVGHLALAKESPESRALEWGIAVVDPRWRGMGLMERMLQAAMDQASRCPEPILCAHAVTAHPYTQKTCLKFGFRPVALLLGYAPATLRFRGIDQSPGRRESTFLAARCTHPLPPQFLHLPSRHAAAILRLLETIGAAPAASNHGPADDAPALGGIQTEFSSLSAHCIGAGKIQVSKVGEDVDPMLRRELRRLCRDRVDVVYLTLDLADPGVGKAVLAAERLGFFFAGLAPMLGPPCGLTLQYLHNFDVDFDALHAQGEIAEWLKTLVRNEKSRVESA